MSKEVDFIIYCIEIYKRDKNLTGKETIKIFTKYQVLEYITKYYEALHTTGEKYTINDIDLYINARKMQDF